MKSGKWKVEIEKCKVKDLISVPTYREVLTTISRGSAQPHPRKMSRKPQLRSSRSGNRLDAGQKLAIDHVAEAGDEEYRQREYADSVLPKLNGPRIRRLAQEECEESGHVIHWIVNLNDSSIVIELYRSCLPDRQLSPYLIERAASLFRSHRAEFDFRIRTICSDVRFNDYWHKVAEWVTCVIDQHYRIGDLMELCRKRVANDEMFHSVINSVVEFISI